jgi:hypothetical protein
MASTLDLERFLAQINQAESLAPMLDPTLYMKARDNLHAFKKLAMSLLPVKTAFEDAFKAILETAAKGHMENRVLDE